MKEAEEKIWAYLDDSISPAEREEVERLLASDLAFRESFRRTELLHRQLQHMETEMPSLRFTQNVMDKLPAVRPLATQPLVSEKWMRSFGWSFMSLLLLFGGTSSLMALNAERASSDATELAQLLAWMARLTTNGASTTLFLGGIIIISVACLFFLDRWLQARFKHAR